MSKITSKTKKTKKYKKLDDSDNDSDQEILEEAKERYMKTEFFEKVNKYIQYDDIIKETMMDHRKEINELKSQKKDLELYLLKYLERIEQDTINVGETDRIVKVEKQRKAPLSKEIMRCAIIEDLKKEGKIENEKEGEEIIERMFKSMENKRPVKSIVQLKRKKLKNNSDNGK